jgi:hypothetical protein
MAQRAVDCETAQEVSVAQELARLGATAALIERLTGFGARWNRSLVRRYGGPIAQKPRDARFFDEDPARRHQGWLCIVMSEDQPANLSPGAQLVEAYIAYRGSAQQPGILDINESAQVIDLYRTGNAWIRSCTQCKKEHLVLSERQLCPECWLMSRTFCKNCDRQLEESARHTTLYCSTCSTSAERIALRRRARRNRRAGQLLEVGPARITAGYLAT